jgi:hypothetical protein
MPDDFKIGLVFDGESGGAVQATDQVLDELERLEKLEKKLSKTEGPLARQAVEAEISRGKLRLLNRELGQARGMFQKASAKASIWNQKLEASNKKQKVFTDLLGNATVAFGPYALAGGVALGTVTALGVAAVKVTSELVELTQEIADEGDQLLKLSDRLGESTEMLSEWQFVAEKSRIKTETFNMALQRLERRAADFKATGGGEAKEALEALGLANDVLAGKFETTEDLLLAVSDKMAGLEDKSERVRIAFKLFDSEGVSMIQMLKDGSLEIEKQIELAKQLGWTWSEDSAKAATALKDATFDLEAQIKGLRIEMGQRLTPVLGAATEGLGMFTAGIRAGVIPEIKAALSHVGKLYAALSALAGSFAGTLRTAAATPIINALPGVRQAAEVVTTLQEGGMAFDMMMDQAAARFERRMAGVKVGGGGGGGGGGGDGGGDAAGEADQAYQAEVARWQQQQEFDQWEADYDAKKAADKFELERERLQALYDQQVEHDLKMEEEAKAHQEKIIGAYTELGQGLTDTLAGSMADAALGFEVSGQRMIAAAGKTVGGVIASFGTELVAAGVKDVVRGFAISANPFTPGAGAALIKAGGAEVAKGVGLKALGSGMGGGSGGGSVSAGGGGGGGRGVAAPGLAEQRMAGQELRVKVEGMDGIDPDSFYTGKQLIKMVTAMEKGFNEGSVPNPFQG